MKKKVILLLFLVLVVCGCGRQDDTSKGDETLEKVIAEKNYIIVDVRTKEEYDTGHVVNAINIPYDEIGENVSLDKKKTILVYCKSGTRSRIAYNTLKDLGYEVIDLGAYDSVSLEKE